MRSLKESAKKLSPATFTVRCGNHLFFNVDKIIGQW
jgi:hypothetical protein